MDKNIKLSIIIPCYNEVKNIPLILDKFSQCISRNDIEVILVDNGSTDGTNSTLQELLPLYPFGSSIKVEENQGYGYGITTGLNIARGEYIGYTHADLQTDPYDVIKALEIAEQKNDSINLFIKGRRKGRKLFDNFFTIGMSFFESILLRRWLWDINAQPNIFSRNFYLEIKEYCPKDFSLDLFFLYQAKKNGLKITRFDVVFPERIHGVSSWNSGLSAKWKFIKRTIAYSLRLRKLL